MAKQFDTGSARGRRPQPEQVAARKNLMPIFDKTTLPVDIRMAVLDIGVTLDPYEKLAYDVWNSGDSERRSDYMETLQIAGVFDEELSQQVHKASYHLGKTFLDRAEALQKRGYARGGEKQYAGKDVFASLRKHEEEYNGNNNHVLDAIGKVKRPLLGAMFHEIIISAAMSELELQMKSKGAEVALADAARFLRGQPNSAQELGKNVNWCHFVHGFAKRAADVTEAPGTAEQKPFGNRLAIHEWLHSVDLDPSVAGAIPLPSLSVDQKIYEGRLIVNKEQQHPLGLAGFEIYEVGKPPLVAGDVSRLNGELCLNGMNLSPIKRTFTFFGVPQLYDAIKKDIFLGIFQRYEQAQVPPQDRAALRELLGLDPGEVVQPKVHTDEPTKNVVPTQEGVVLTPTALPMLPTAVVEQSKTRKPRFTEIPERMSIRAVKEAIRDCAGIDVVTNRGDHMHFVSAMTRNAPRFFNVHGSGKSSRMMFKREVQALLVDVLGVSVEEFLSHVKAAT